MLYNKDWEKPQVQVDPLTLDSLIAWLETMPPRAKYDYMDCHGTCMYGLYMRYHGISWRESGASGADRDPPERVAFCQIVYQKVAVPRPWTFGSALKRARAANLPDRYQK